MRGRRHRRHVWWQYKGDAPCYKEIRVLDAYTSDLNACHEMEKTLTNGQWLIYEYALQSPSAMRGDYHHRHIIHATAAQRAEAFLRTIGKWTEPKSP